MAERLCARCGRIRDDGEARCARCGAAPLPIRWAGGPARDNWFDAGLRVGLGGVTWPAVGATAVLSIGLLAGGAIPAALALAVPSLAAGIKRRAVNGWVVDQFAVAFGKFWRWSTTDGNGRGAMVTLGQRRVAGFGTWLELVEEQALDAPPVSAAEVIAAGPSAVARELAALTPLAPLAPLGRPLDPVHVLLLAAVTHQMTRGALRTWRAERWMWFHHSSRPAVELRTGSATPPTLAWARGSASPPPDATLEHALLIAFAEQAARRGGGALVGAPRLPGNLGDPYRAAGPAFTDVPPPTEALKLGVSAVGDLLVRHRSAPASPDAAIVAARLAAIAAGAPFLTAHVIAEAENVRIAWFDG